MFALEKHLNDPNKQMTSVGLYHQVVKTPIGLLNITASEDAICSVQLLDKDRFRHSEKSSSLTTTACEQLTSYFKGNLQEFVLPLAFEGTPFQQQVWQQLLNIPYGNTISYGELAEKIGNKNSVRAVGAANGKNKIPIIVPCHRVIAANGKLQGFALGLDVKRYLLTLEYQKPEGMFF